MPLRFGIGNYYEATIPSSAWSTENFPSTAEITVNGIEVDDRPFVSLNYNKILKSKNITDEIDLFNFIFRVEVVGENTLKFYSWLFLSKDLDILIRVN